MRIGINALTVRPGFGGSLTYPLSLLPALQSEMRDDDELVVITTPDGRTALNRAGLSVDWRVYHWPGHGVAHRMLWEQTVLPTQVRRLGLDILFSPAPPIVFLSPCTTVFAVRNKAPFDPFALSLLSPQVRMRMQTRRLLAIASAKRADGIIAVSQDIATVLPRDVRHKVSVIYHGRDPMFCPEMAKEQSQTWANRFGEFILYVASFYPYRNHKRLLGAFRQISSRQLNVSLVFAGLLTMDKVYTASIRRLVEELGLGKKVHLLGHVPHEQLPGLYGACQLFVFPSLTEACPNTLIEAMACGCSILASNRPPMPEIAGDAVLYFDPFDETDIAGKIQTVRVCSETRNRLARKATQRAERFSWSLTARQTLDVLRKAVHPE